MDFTNNLPIKYCRICFKDRGKNVTSITEEICENFHSLTNIHVSLEIIIKIIIHKV